MKTRLLAMTCALVIGLILGPWQDTLRAAEEEMMDIVFALDVSLSMKDDAKFEKVRDRLIEFIQDELDLDTNVVVVTFGEDARLIARQMVRTKEDKAAIVAQLRQLQPNAQGTYMGAGIDMALAELQALHRTHRGRGGILVMLTDGKNEPPDNVPRSQQITFQKLLAKWTNVADFKSSKDWFFWYCFIGNPEKEVRDFAESMGGESKPVTGPWKFLKVRFNRVLLKLPDVAPGQWTTEYPPAADRQLGEQLLVSTRAPGEYDLEISNVILDEARSGEKITVSPRRVRMNQPEQPVILQFAAEGIAAGERRGRIIFRAPGKMVFVQPQQLRVLFRAVEAAVTVVPREGVALGRLLPGEKATGTIELVPNDAALRIAGGKIVQLVLPQDLPKGVTIFAEPKAPALAAGANVQLRVSAAGDAVLPPEGYKGKIALAGVDGVSFLPASVPLSFEGSRAEIDVFPKTVDFGTVAPGGQSIRDVLLTPNEAAAALGAGVSVASHAPLPQGVTLDVEPTSPVARGKTNVRLTLRMSTDAAGAGDLKGSISLKAAQASVALSSSELTWEARRAAAVVDVTPGSRLDFETLEPGQRKTQSLWLSPNPAAAARKPTIRLSAEAVPPGTSLRFEPQELSLTAKQEVKVTLAAGPAVGQQKLKLRLATDTPGVELAVQELEAAYTGETGGITLDVDRVVFEDCMPGNSEHTRKIHLAASPGAAGETVALQWTFPKLPKGMTVVPSPNRLTISQSGENVELSLAMKGAVPGHYAGRVRLAAKSKVRPEEIGVEFQVAEPVVEVEVPAQTWSIAVSPFRPRGTASLPVVLKANRAAQGTVISVNPGEKLPPGVKIVVAPSTLKMATGENRCQVNATVELSPSFSGSRYAGELKFVADRSEVAIRPATVPWEVIAPALRNYAIAIAVLATLGYLAYAKCFKRRCVLAGREMIGGLGLLEVPGTTKVLFRGATQSEGEEMRIGTLRQKRIVIGSATPKDPHPADITIEGDSGVRKQHVMIYNRGGRHYLYAWQSVDIESPKRRHLGPGRKDRLYDHDQVRIGSVLLEFRNPGDKRRV